MNDKLQSNPFMAPFAATDLFQFMSASPLVDMQRRNIEAMTKSAAKISEAMASVASKQMAAFSDLSALRPAEPPHGPADLAGFFAAQFNNGRDVMEKAITEMRDANDTICHCWYDVASEFENCARENMSSIDEQLKKSSGQQLKAVSPATQPRKAAAE